MGSVFLYIALREGHQWSISLIRSVWTADKLLFNDFILSLLVAHPRDPRQRNTVYEEEPLVNSTLFLKNLKSCRKFFFS